MLHACVGSALPVDLAAQKLEYKEITLDWLRYVRADPTLDAKQIARRERTAAAQELRIRKAGETPGAAQ